MGLKPLSLKSLNDCLKTLFKDGVDRREDFSLYYKVHHVPPLLSCPNIFSLADIHSRLFIRRYTCTTRQVLPSVAPIAFRAAMQSESLVAGASTQALPCWSWQRRACAISSSPPAPSRLSPPPPPNSKCTLMVTVSSFLDVPSGGSPKLCFATHAARSRSGWRTATSFSRRRSGWAC